MGKKANSGGPKSSPLKNKNVAERLVDEEVAPKIAIAIYKRWLGFQEEEDFGYPQDSVIYRLIFDERMKKVWPKLRQCVKAERLTGRSIEEPLYVFALSMRTAVQSARRQLRELPAISDMKSGFESIAAKADSLLKAMNGAAFGEYRGIVEKVSLLAKARALASSSEKYFEKEVSKAIQDMENFACPGRRPGSDEATIKRRQIAERATIERENNPVFAPRIVLRRRKGSSKNVLATIRMVVDQILPHTFEPLPSQGVQATLISVALAQEVTIEQIKDAQK